MLSLSKHWAGFFSSLLVLLCHKTTKAAWIVALRGAPLERRKPLKSARNKGFMKFRDTVVLGEDVSWLFVDVNHRERIKNTVADVDAVIVAARQEAAASPPDYDQAARRLLGGA